MNLVTVEHIEKSYGEKQLLEDINFGISEGEKIGVIGINGTGKSTLLKIISGIVVPDKGQIICGNNVRIEYMDQNPEFDFNTTVLQQVFKGNSTEMKLLREYEETLEVIKEGDLTKNDTLIKLQSKIDGLNLWDLESEAKSILTQLGILDFSAKVSTLSGGQRKRIALASALITPCELLILDEPTNHMDSSIVKWLEEYLNRRKGALLMITHDRYFLDRVTNRIIEIDGGNYYSYDGNYSVYVEKKAERQDLEVNLLRKRKNIFRKELAWIRRGAKARSTKQKARIDRFETLKEQVVDIKQQQLEVAIEPPRLGNKIVEIEDVTKSFDEKIVVQDFTYRILKDDRIGIVGENGAGKSTLMNLITGRIEPNEGTVEVGETVKIGYFSQETYHMDEAMRVIDYIREIGEYLPLANGERITASKMLERFLFDGDLQYARIGDLSGGERRRLYLLSVLMSGPNMMILDEPTNDLDIATLTILEDFLDSFKGPVIAVSHDRYFLDRICEKIFAFKANGEIINYPGNYSDYLERVSGEENSKVDTKKPKKSITTRKERPKKLKFTFQEKKEYETIDEDIETLENKLAECEEAMNQAGADYGKLSDLSNQKEELESNLAHKYERWTYLNELAEKINQSNMD